MVRLSCKEGSPETWFNLVRLLLGFLNALLFFDHDEAGAIVGFQRIEQPRIES